MKFHKSRTKTKSNIDGLKNYLELSQKQEIRIIEIRLTSQPEIKFWQKISITDINIVDQRKIEPLEISHVEFRIREPVVDELTRHKNTDQFFIPITGPITAVVARNIGQNEGMPDNKNIFMVNVIPGEVLVIKKGVWHTLPFTFSQDSNGLSVMYRDKLENYHDVRDLVVEGWVGLLSWEDPI